MRSDQQTINGLTAYKLDPTQSSSYANILFNFEESPTNQYIGIKVWKRAADGTETEITAGTAVAIATGGSGLISAEWSCPFVDLEPTDAIIVRVYANDSTPPTELIAEFITEQLNGYYIAGSTWTVYYYLAQVYSKPLLGYLYYFRFGTSTYNSRIDNFSWMPIAVAAEQVIMDGFVLITL